jgi:hypothetical protein
MTKWLGIAAVTLAMTLTGCGGADDVSADKGTTVSETSTPVTTEPTTESTPTEDDSSSSSSAGGPYCDALKHAKTNLSSIDFTKLDEKTYATLTTELGKVRAAAPAGVEDDWGVLIATLADLHRLLASAGISFDDLQDLSAGTPPPGTDLQKLQKLAPKLQKISSDVRLQEASTTIQHSASKACGLSLD